MCRPQPVSMPRAGGRCLGRSRTTRSNALSFTKQFPNDRLIGGGESKTFEFLGSHPAPIANSQRLDFAGSVDAVVGVQRDLKMAVSMIDFNQFLSNRNLNT